MAMSLEEDKVKIGPLDEERFFCSDVQVCALVTRTDMVIVMVKLMVEVPKSVSSVECYQDLKGFGTASAPSSFGRSQVRMCPVV